MYLKLLNVIILYYMRLYYGLSVYCKNLLTVLDPGSLGVGGRGLVGGGWWEGDTNNEI